MVTYAAQAEAVEKHMAKGRRVSVTRRLELISIDPTICHGQPCIKGTRIMVTIVLDALASGLDTADPPHSPTVTSDGVRAAPACSAWLAKQEIPPSRPPREDQAPRQHHRRGQSPLRGRRRATGSAGLDPLVEAPTGRSSTKQT